VPSHAPTLALTPHWLQQPKHKHCHTLACDLCHVHVSRQMTAQAGCACRLFASPLRRLRVPFARAAVHTEHAKRAACGERSAFEACQAKHRACCGFCLANVMMQACVWGCSVRKCLARRCAWWVAQQRCLRNAISSTAQLDFDTTFVCNRDSLRDAMQRRDLLCL
jgi:hypothetical protein